jgi:hypothetical protein
MPGVRTRRALIKPQLTKGGITIPSLKPGPERFFYHSFPRRRGTDTSDEAEKGGAILRLMKEMGLLLTPEIIEWPDVQPDGSLSEPWYVAQKRCCFTELAPAELPQHAEVFGHFAIEFGIQVLRSLGAIPVFYLPRTSEANAGLEALSTALVAGIGQLEALFDRLSQLEELVRSNPHKDERLLVTENGIVTHETECSVGGAEDLLSFLTKAQPVLSLHAILKTVSSFIYPTEDLRYIDLHGYYQQREWRILPNMARDGIELTRPLRAEEMESLLELDRAFFSRQLSFRTGTFRRVDQCRLFEHLDGKSIIRYARRIIVPEIAVARAKEILNEPNDPPVVALESLAATQ